MNLHNHQLYLLEQHSESFKIWSAIIRISTEGKSSIMKFGPGIIVISIYDSNLSYVVISFKIIQYIVKLLFS